MNYKDLVENILNEYLKEQNLTLYSVEYVKEDGNNILRVLIDNLENQIDIDKLAEVNEYLSSNLNDDDFIEEYYLEVSSPGAERVLNGINEIEKSIGKYVFVIDVKNDEYLGYLMSCNDEFIEVKVNLKGRMKNFKIEISNIKLIRLAIKF